MEESPACFALGYVEENGSVSGFFALRPKQPIPSFVTQQGCCFGHSVIGSIGSPVLHFAFKFYGYETYNGLVMPNNPIVQSVIATMIKTKDYFFFAINSDCSVTSFRSHLESDNLSGLKTNYERFQEATCDLEEYKRVYQAYSAKPSPPGQVMRWVCRNNPDYLSLQEQHRLEMNPRG